MTMGVPLISVVIPAYNRGQTIKYCLDSVVRQTYANIEVIVVDDCSTDETVAMVRKYPDTRVRCVSLENKGGAQVARNRGIREAKGEWIAFQDSDDEWMPTKLEKQVRALEAMHYDPWILVYCDVIKFDRRNKKTKPWKRTALEGENVYAKQLVTSSPILQSMLTSKLALEKIGCLDENVPAHHEWDTSIRLAKFCKFIRVNEPLVRYNIHTGDTISKDTERDINGSLYIINKHRADIRTYCGEKSYERLLTGIAWKSLDFNLHPEYERIISSINWNNHFVLRRTYLRICYLIHLAPSNFVVRSLRRLVGQIRMHYNLGIVR